MNAYSAPFVAREAIHWLKDIHDPKKPFVLSIWVHEPHAPIATDDPFLEPYGKDVNAMYMGNITQLDFALGQVMDALDEQGLTENTLFIFTSDNGPEGKGGIKGGSTGGLRGRKRDDFEGGIRVPGIVRWPGHIQPGTVSDIPIIGSDIFATALDVAGVHLPTDRKIDGVSMLPAFDGKPLVRDIPMFWRTHVSLPDSRVAIRIGNWKMVGNETMDVLLLFNVVDDPAETKNLAETFPEKYYEIKQKLFEVWDDIQAEGPGEWWLDPNNPIRKGYKLAY